jgi:riboflavin transporter FmnP
MIDINLNELRILPADHLAFRDLDFNEAVQKENKYLKTTIVAFLLISGIIALLNFKKQYEKSREH